MVNKIGQSSSRVEWTSEDWYNWLQRRADKVAQDAAAAAFDKADNAMREMGQVFKRENEQLRNDLVVAQRSIGKLESEVGGLIDIVATLNEKINWMESQCTFDPAPPGPPSNPPDDQYPAAPPGPPGGQDGRQPITDVMMMRSVQDGGNLILNEWMAGHPMHAGHAPAIARYLDDIKPQKIMKPDGCQHAQADWFCMGFNPAWLEDPEQDQGYFASASDWPVDPGSTQYWNNRLFNMCNSLKNTCDLSDSNLQKLCSLMRQRRDLALAWHNPKSGGFYLQVACKNCGSRTGQYQPHQDVDELGLNPQSVSGAHYKQLLCVKAAFRSFLANVFNVPILALGSQCRHLQRTADTDPWGLQAPQATPALLDGTPEA